MFLVIVVQWERPENFWEEKLGTFSCFIVPSIDKVALCLQVAPGWTWAGMEHAGEFDLNALEDVG